jgi:hypothetical protein
LAGSQHAELNCCRSSPAFKQYNYSTTSQGNEVTGAPQKISDVLQEAQNLLGETHRDADFICHAIAIAMGVTLTEGNHTPAAQFLNSLGMPLHGGGFSSYTRPSATYYDTDFLDGSTSQELRYAWLELAIQVALEEGL